MDLESALMRRCRVFRGASINVIVADEVAEPLPVITIFPRQHASEIVVEEDTIDSITQLARQPKEWGSLLSEVGGLKGEILA